jgi:alcohol dehydrogenase YqhD (iron-dependent ADH family)
MINFNYYNPTKICFGNDAISKISIELKNEENKKCLLVYGKNSIKNNGTYEKVVSELNKLNINIIEHSGVTPNPKLSHTELGIEIAKRERVDFVMGIGGGSVIDESKAIAIGALTSTNIWDFYIGKDKVEKALPIYTVLTMPATASEMNPISVLSNDKTEEKLAIFAEGIINPKISFLDPTTTLSLPYNQVSNAGVDIISHLTEAYFTTTGEYTSVQDGVIEGIVKAVIELTKKIKDEPNNYDYRASFMWAATLGWNRLAQMGMPNTSMPCHAIEMPMSGVYDIAHGAGLAVVTPAWLKFEEKRIKHRILKFGRNVFNMDTNSTEEVINQLIVFYRSIDAPTTFTELGIMNPNISRLTELTIRALKSRNINTYTQDDIKTIYNFAL